MTSLDDDAGGDKSSNTQTSAVPTSTVDSTTVHSTESESSSSTADSASSSAGETIPPPDCQSDELPYGSSCYYFGSSKRTWESARERCQRRGDGWDLAAINSLGEHEWVAPQLEGDTWIGGFQSNNQWLWSNSDTVFWVGNETGEAIDGAFTQWDATEPDAEGNDQQCVRYADDSGQWAWTDAPCQREYRYVCEK